MAPRPSLARRTLAPQGEHIYELGVVGRKTGVTVPDSGVRDEHGMEPIENLFSSPGKSDNEDQQEEGSDGHGSGEEAMDITTTSGIGPAAMLNGHGNRLPVPLSRVRSPAKTLLNSPAQRNRFLARNSSSPARGAAVRTDDFRFSSQPTGNQASTKRRLDFQSVANGGPHSLSRPQAHGHHLQPLQHDEEEGEGEQSDHDREDDEVNNFVEESMAMLNDGDDYDNPPEPDPAQNEAEEEEEDGSAAENETEDPPAPAAKKRQGRPPKQKQTAAARAAKPRKKTAQPVAEEEDGEDQQDDEEHPEGEEEEEEEEEQEPTPKPQKPTPGRRGRPPKAGKPSAPPAQAPPRGAKKRRSLDQEEAAEEPSSEPKPKRPRASPAPNAEKPAPKKAAAPARKTPEPPAAAAPKPRGRRRRSSVEPGDVSQVAVARRPPLPKSRGLLISRREVPGDPNSSMHRTRSGRTSFKPLAWWRNERVEFDKDEAEDAFVGRKHKGKFVLPSVKEVYRVDEPEPETRARSRRGGKKAPGRRGRRRSSGGGGGDFDDDDYGPAEPWELDPGTVTGEVVVWQPEYEYQPPAPNDLVSVMDKQLAISSAAIKTTEVVGGEFRYAKVFSEGFIGAGVVDLPPGAVKRLKNSRKVFMIFFMHVGRVRVTVQETSFRISKGGMFIVPRYNEYTIENDYDQPARIFFAQGQEVAVSPPPEQEAAEEDQDADEEVEVSEGEEVGSGEE
ncbi:kinetochore CENP-C fungal-like protein [Thermothelomyces heterothallicus CBS 202.75]|uniref:kinetochore CENP-C fungal-like protein n=1 Tax=Thermothelomyces heterothallicus CBS 202.75 TaxID=1149848 RepID=UPI0037441AA1